MEERRQAPYLRTLLLGVGIPSVVSVIALALIWSSLPELPSPVAIHWGPSGVPDGFGPPVTYLIMVGLIGWVLPLLMTAPWKTSSHAATSKFMVMTAVWLSIFIAVIAVGAVFQQRGLSTAKDAPGVGYLILLAAAAGAVGALIPYLLLPETPAPLPGETIAPLPLLEGQTVVWTSVAVMSRWFTVSLTAVIVLMAGGALFAAPHYLLGTAAVLGLLLLGFSVFKVSVGRQGILIRGYLGFPKIRVPLDQIVQVTLVEVAPMQEWGGWGWRLRPGGQGIITRAGSAIQVLRRDGKIVVVTAEDSTVGCATLAALVERVRSEK